MVGVEANHNNYLSATKAAYELRKKRLVPLASMDPMEGLEISSYRDANSPLNNGKPRYFNYDSRMMTT